MRPRRCPLTRSISGSLAGLAARFPERIAAALKLSLVAQSQSVSLAVSRLRDNLLLGASELAFEPLLRDPEGLIDELISSNDVRLA